MNGIQDFGRKIGGAKKDRAAAAASTPSGETLRRPRRKRPEAAHYCIGTSLAAFGNTLPTLYRRGDKLYRAIRQFADIAEARAWWAATLAADDRGAAVLSALWADAKAATDVTEESIRRRENRPRRGYDYRQGGDVSPDDFTGTFHPYGIEFGNWQTDRQGALNRAYDALQDLAGVVRLSPAALFMGEGLGLAFGARGHGKAAAHYEPARRVINLTKTAGAGCLAHEWFHAWEHAEGLTPAVETTRQILRGLPFAARSRLADKGRAKPYWSTDAELMARAFESWVASVVENDYLANIMPAGDFTKPGDRYPYPTGDEMTTVAEAFRSLFRIG